MNVAEAVVSLEQSAVEGGCSAEAVEELKGALDLAEWLHALIERLKVMRVGPTDVLTLRLPAEMLADEEEMRKVHDAARDIAEVARRGVVLLSEDAPLQAEHLATMVRPPPRIHVPRGRMDVPRNGR